MDEIDVEEETVRRLLGEQHLDLAELTLRRVRAGWDNRMWRLGDALAVRLPRTPRAPSLLRKEQEWLPLLAPRLPLPVPVPVRAGEPSGCFPQPWAVVSWVAGDAGDRAPVSRGHDAADRLAGFLRALHRGAPAGAVLPSPNRGVDLGLFAPEFHEKFHAVAGTGVAAQVRAVWDAAVRAPGWEGPPVWLHGDLHPANVVIADGTIAGVIDFGELCTGDPATDLAAAWLLLPAGAAPRFFTAYGHVDPATMGRARGWAVLRAVSLIGIGRAWERGLPGGQPTWGQVGRAALGRVLRAG
ncbi:phosphotransferase [Streptomyces sp. NPDC101206]|uniref:phosphotransferase n=1 Tax=Streptomyces sp. NPDC101206 TaxID=3366128 RepID=UPI0037F9A018